MQKVIDIHNYLPHRKPMLMVDLITGITRETVETAFLLRNDNIFVENGRMCEAGLIENAAQTCAAIVAKKYFVDDDDHAIPNADVIGFISSIKTLKIHSLPLVGCDIITKASLISRFDTGDFITCMMSCSSYCNDELLLEAEINLFIKER